MTRYLPLLLLALASTAHAQRATPCDPATPNNAVCITWNAVTTRIDGLPTNLPVTYRVEQRIGTGTYAAVSTAAPTQAYVRDLAPGDYTFRVYAIEGTKTSAASNTAGRAVDQAAPSAPIIIIAATIRAGQEPTFRVVYTVRPRPGEVVFVVPEALRPYVAAR